MPRVGNSEGRAELCGRVALGRAQGPAWRGDMSGHGVTRCWCDRRYCQAGSGEVRGEQGAGFGVHFADRAARTARQLDRMAQWSLRRRSLGNEVLMDLLSL